MKETSDAMITFSSYLKDIEETREYMHEVLEEITSSINFQKNVLAPISLGIIIGLTTLVINILVTVGKSVEDFYSQIISGNTEISTLFFFSVSSINEIIQPGEFQVIISFYLMEIVILLSYTYSLIKFGEGTISLKNEIGKSVMVSILLYILISITSYYALTSLVPMEEIVK